MTTANPSHARPGGPAQAWRLFRRWQRSRPFWGGLLIALAGVEMFASTRMTLNGLSFHSGATGLLSLLIPIILVTCGLLLWFTPAQRLFYSVVAAVTAVYSLIGLNLGGFFVGLLLGIVGSALAFAWTPIRPTPPTPPPAEIEQNGDDPGRDDRRRRPSGAGLAGVGLADGDADGPTVAAPSRTVSSQTGAGQGGAGRGGVVPVDHPGGGASDEGAPPEWPGRSADPRAFAVALRGARPGSRRPGQPAPSGAGRTEPTGPDRLSRPRPGPSPRRPAAARPRRRPPRAGPRGGGNMITDILDGIGDLLGGGRPRRPRRRSARPDRHADSAADQHGDGPPRPHRLPVAAPGQTGPGQARNAGTRQAGNACSRASLCRGSPPTRPCRRWPRRRRSSPGRRCE